MERTVFYNKVKPVGVRRNCMVENHAMTAMALPGSYVRTGHVIGSAPAHQCHNAASY